MSLLPTIITLLSLAAITAALDQLITSSKVPKSCLESDCSACRNNCPDTAVIAKIYWNCYKHRTFYYTQSDNTDIEAECKRQPCLQFLAPRACNIIPYSYDSDVLQEMKLEITRIKQQLQEVETERKEVMRRGLQDKQAVAYYVQYVAQQRKCDQLFSKALEARARYLREKRRKDSVEYRAQQLEMRRLSSESENMRNHVRFWQYQNETLSEAARTSPLQLVKARNELLANLEAFKEDAELVDILRSSSVTKENQYSLLTTLKGQLREQVSTVRTTNAHVMYELSFIRAARKEIYRFLSSVLYRIGKGRLKVGCGGTALGKVAGDMLLD